MALLQVQGLTKWFGGLTACDRVSAEIQEGEIVGLIGPNGAGNTTPFNDSPHQVRGRLRFRMTTLKNRSNCTDFQRAKMLPFFKDPWKGKPK